MMLMIPAVYQGGHVDPNFVPDVEMMEKMNRFNEDLAKARLLKAGDGLNPPTNCVHFTYENGVATEVEGPVAKGAGVVGGYWVIKVASQDEAIAWARKIPAEDGDRVEIRQIADMEDSPGGRAEGGG